MNFATEAKKMAENKTRDIILKWAKVSESEPRLKATLSLASSELGMVIAHNQLDADPWELAFRNGMTYNLKTGMVRAIHPDDYCMKSMGADYDPKATCPLWERFLLEVFHGDVQLVNTFNAWSDGA